MKKIIVAITMVATLIMSTFSLVACNGNTFKTEQKKTNIPKNISSELVVSDTKSSGIRLMKAKLATADYVNYGVSVAAETAYTLTATIEPESAGNQKVNWSMEFTNPNDWSQGKNVSDYITLSKSSDTKTATISCKAPFGCQITVTATSENNPSASATCTLDYAQRLTSASLNFGNIPINLGGETLVKYEVAPGVQGMGGKVTANLEKSDVYSLSENFETTVTLTQKMIDDKYFALKNYTISGVQIYSEENAIGKQIYYDYDHDISKWFITQRSGDILFNTLSTAEIISYLSEITQPILYEVTLTVTGKYSSYTYTSTVKCNGYTNNMPVESLNLNESEYVF